MDVKDAVQKAKLYIMEIFASEGVTNLGLEEVEFDDQSKEWVVTIGFSRPWDKSEGGLAALAYQITNPNRSYKVVRIDEGSAKVRSVKNREAKS